MTFRAVWTDFGGVLTPPVNESFAGFAAQAGAPPAVLWAAMQNVAARYGVDDVMAPLDTPLTTEADWARQVTAVVREDTGAEVDLSRLGERWFAGRPANSSWVGTLRKLREQGVFVGLLSNMPPSWDEQWRRMVSPELFDSVVLSYEVGSRKPEAAIFGLAVERCGFPVGECVLVDDMAKNCAGARETGWQAVHFTSSDDAAAELDRQRVGT
ncbi:HAD family phosphatase [Saccharopolyspora sp. ASAGF58]|uniref:HAD family hydrolase n=1 Tax=Saccharopolyspora sp. ASAGF58 TaxID=2719023 RepID=UPI00143FD284|nr:HAD family phosphatase [Saccharopolyspora sp. ASAGF58]QIZ37343.1 HAD family phosphatase [Saccharopolyspora sp. ASAGF58]